MTAFVQGYQIQSVVDPVENHVSLHVDSGFFIPGRSSGKSDDIFSGRMGVFTHDQFIHGNFVVFLVSLWDGEFAAVHDDDILRIFTDIFSGLDGGQGNMIVVQGERGPVDGTIDPQVVAGAGADIVSECDRAATDITAHHCFNCLYVLRSFQQNFIFTVCADIGAELQIG